MHLTAQKLYESDAPMHKWLEAFTPLELAKLWYDLCVYQQGKNGQMIAPQAYDDEVYEALNHLGYWDLKTGIGD